MVFKNYTTANASRCKLHQHKDFGDSISPPYTPMTHPMTDIPCDTYTVSQVPWTDKACLYRSALGCRLMQFSCSRQMQHGLGLLYPGDWFHALGAVSY